MPADYVKVGRFEMARVKIISGTVVNGRPVGVGEVVDVSGSDYYFLVGAQRAVKYVEPVKEEPPVVVPEKTGFPEKPLNLGEMSRAQLLTVARDRGVEVQQNASRKQLIEVLSK
jgi:hypothetical protein